jgi:hypothetical protein
VSIFGRITLIDGRVNLLLFVVGDSNMFVNKCCTEIRARVIHFAFKSKSRVHVIRWDQVSTLLVNSARRMSL